MTLAAVSAVLVVIAGVAVSAPNPVAPAGWTFGPPTSDTGAARTPGTSTRPSLGPTAAPPATPASGQSGVPGVTPTLGPTPSASPSPPEWTIVPVASRDRAADLTANTLDASGVALDTTFTLHSRNGTPAVVLATGIESRPPLAFAVQAGADTTTAVLRPSAALTPGATYQIRLRTSASTVAGSWSFTAKQPLHVVNLLPGYRATGVPIDTGIEITFDQDGVTHASEHVAIQPPVPGRFEQHGRTLTFVPLTDLAQATVYTVTLTRGVSIQGSDQVLETDLVTAFETAAAPATPIPTETVTVGRQLFEAAPGEAPILGITVYAEGGRSSKTVPVQVYRLPSIKAAAAATRSITAGPDWASWSSSGLVQTASLTRVLAFSGRLETIDEHGDDVVRFPVGLDAGWYLVVLPRPGRDQQAVLQVSDVAIYAMTTDTETLAWVNDIASGQPLPGADVKEASGLHLGITGSDGLMITPTPRDLRITDPVLWQGIPPIVVVTAPDGRAAIAALGVTAGPMYVPATLGRSQADEPSERFHLVLATDRWQYRRTDTLNAWGVVRERDSGAVPALIQLRLVTNGSSGQDGPQPAIVLAETAPDARGMFAASLAFSDLPLGDYILELWAGDRQLTSTYIGVADIRKPAFSVAIATGRHAYVAGERIRASASVAFFDGTRAPGVELQFGGPGSTPRATTDAYGVATTTFTAGTEGATEGWQSVAIGAAPAHPEEGEIAGAASVAVFPSSWWIAATATAPNGVLDVAGTLSELDRERVERAVADTGDIGNPAGAPVPGRQMNVTVVEEIPVRTAIGRSYDFVTKQAVTLYAYDTRTETMATPRLTTAADGTFRFTLSLPNRSHFYQLQLSAVDSAGRAVSLSLSVVPSVPDPSLTSNGARRPSLGDAATCGIAEPVRYHVGESVTVVFRDPDGPLPTGGDNRYLFTVSRQGLRNATVQRASVFTRPFAEVDIPNASIGAVWFTGRGYVPAMRPVVTALNLADRALTITLTPDRLRYAPGDHVSLTVRTTDRQGRPTAASVVLRAVDEKLFAIGAAADVDLLSALYQFVDPGVLGTYTSHEPPYPNTDAGCGDTTGGGGDFRDWLLFRKIVTGPDGTATVSFSLSDDLTSWHVSAAALNGRYDAGAASVLVPVGVPFFVEAVLAPEYVLGDQPVLRLRAFGSGLRADAAVHFTVSAPTLGLNGHAVDGMSFQDVRVALPPLTPGVHIVDITGESGTGSARLAFHVVRHFAVIPSRLSRVQSESVPLTTAWQAPVGSGLTTVVVTDAGRGRFLAVLGSLAGSGGARFDQSLSAAVARSMLIGAYGVPEWSLSPAPWDSRRYQTDAGIALLPYAGPDLALTVRAALAAPDFLDAALLRGAFGRWLEDPNSTRERHVMALAGLAAIGDPVLPGLQAVAAERDLTIREQLYLGVAFAAAGDDADAQAIELALLADHGEQLGPWVRLAVGSSLDDTLEATSLLALLAASVGDPIGARAEAYVESNPGHDDLFLLQELGYVRRALEHADPATGTFAATVAGDREVHLLGRDESWMLTLTPDQLATLRLEPLAGALAVTSTWAAPFDPAAVPSDSDVTIERTVTPAGDLPEDQLVRVTIRVHFGPQATAACYEVNDRLPSGLAPVARENQVRWDDAALPPGGIWPYLVEGQRVSWCIGPDAKHREFELVYSARVVSPGTYRWEPATIQSTVSSGRLTATPALVITIR